MALIGAYGQLVFEVSRRRVHTFTDLEISDSPRFAEHDVHLEIPILEFTGPGLTEVNFAMNFNWAWNTNPMQSIEVVRGYSKGGIVAALLVGSKPVIRGANLWCLTGLGEHHTWHSRTGALQGATINVSLKQYRALI